MQELIPINIVIGDRTYRIRTAPRDEEVVRKTVRTINDKIVEFKTQFAGKDMQDYIAMVLIWFATTISSEGGQAVQPQGLAEKLKQMETQIDEAMRQ
ncbi:MAG TPA: cell division protein ZapA [Chitinophagaceae bacterium]|nr:cell division protein ZapA [Chitinophagaceae bacterium]